MQRSGILFVVSGPSGSGKSTLCESLRAKMDFVYSISCTTRAPRRGEQDGRDYHFLAEEAFQRQVREGGFLEHARVHGNLYGTPLKPILDVLGRGSDVLLDIDVQGARAIRTHSDPVIRAALVDVFLMPPTVAELERRLRKRKTDDEATIQRRLAASREEMRQWREYAYAIVTGKVEEDYDRFCAIVAAERLRTPRLQFDTI